MAKQTYDHLKPTHDEFFRFLTESPAVRRDLVGVCFPDLAPELGALTVMPGEFSGGKRADLLLSAVDSRGKADDKSSEHLLYFLLEHKARPERMVAVQLLSYAAAILEQHRGPARGRGASPRSPLPRLHIAVLYHGVTPWQVPERLSALQGYDGSGTTEPAVELTYKLIDLNQIPLDRQRLSAESMAGFIVMRSVLRRLGTEQLRLIRDLIFDSGLETHWAVRVLRYLFSYLHAETTQEALPLFRERQYTHQQEQIMYSITDYLIDQGLEKGLEKGQRQAQINIAKRMLAKGIDVQTVCETTELSEAEVRSIQQTGDAPQEWSPSR